LASDTSVYPHVSNVIDGQHRLRAVHRFVNGEFQLTGLEKMESINKLYFEDLSIELKNKLMVQTSLNINYIHVQDDPSLELEIFLRYNRGTNPMTKQEIRHVLFGSPFNDWIIELVGEMKEDKGFKDIFNIAKKRYADKSVHADLFTMFSIFHFGLNKKHVATPYYVDDIMFKTRQMTESDAKHFIQRSKFFFEHYEKFLKSARNIGITYPFSKEIYAPNEKRHLFQSSIMMIITTVFTFILKENIKYDGNHINKIFNAIKKGFADSDFYRATSATTKYELVNGAANSIIEEIQKYC